MDTATAFALFGLFILILLVMSRQQRPGFIFEDDTVRLPSRWNFDWGGGPYYDHSRIMREHGPYFRGGGHRSPHSTPGGDGRPRR